MDTHWICYVEGTDGGRRYKHDTIQSAQTEAERLARLTGKKVYIYEWKGSCDVTLPPVTWVWSETQQGECYTYSTPDYVS